MRRVGTRRSSARHRVTVLRRAIVRQERGMRSCGVDGVDLQIWSNQTLKEMLGC